MDPFKVISALRVDHLSTIYIPSPSGAKNYLNDVGLRIT